MNPSTTQPTITQEFPISVPLHEHYSTQCVFKVMFGKTKYYIAKGKSLLQACETMSISIWRGLKKGTVDETHWYYHVIHYCIKARVIRATAVVLFDGDKKSAFELLKAEQEILNNKKNDPDCLNNNFDAYIPKWIPAKDIKKFKEWKDGTKKSNRIKNSTSNSRKKHKGR